MDSSFPNEEQTSSAKTPSLILPLYSPPFSFIHRTLFFKQPLCLNPSSNLVVETSNVVREVQKSIVCNVDRCLKMLENGVLDKVMSFSSQLQSNFQIRVRNGRNPSTLHNSNFAAILPGDSVAGVVVGNGIMNFLNIYNTLLVARLVLTWFPNAPPAIVSPLSTICDPYLNIFRGIIPPLGGTLDLSPILAFTILNAITSAAAALPAELPSTEGTKGSASRIKPSHITSSLEKWMRRLTGIKPRTSSGDV